MLADGVGEVAESLSQPLDRRQLRVGLDAGAEAFDERLEAGDVETLLAAEVLEDQTVRDSGGRGDLVDRDLVVVAIAEDLERSRDQLEPALSRPVACQRSAGDGARVAPVDYRSTPQYWV
jgi:hypothetical protein